MAGFILAYSAKYHAPINTYDKPATWAIISYHYPSVIATVFANYDGHFIITLFLQNQLNTYQTIAITIMTILAPGLLLNIRKGYYSYNDHANVTELSWNAERSVESGSASLKEVDCALNWINSEGEFDGDNDIYLSVLERGSVARKTTGYPIRILHEYPALLN